MTTELQPYRLLNARVPAGMLPRCFGEPAASEGEGSIVCTIKIGSTGRISGIVPGSHEGPIDAQDIDLGCRHVWARMADIHTHLDKSHTWPRAKNTDGTFTGAKTGAKADRYHPWPADDVRRRMDFSLRSALAHGTGAIRTHIDSQPGRTAPSWGVFEEMREAWAGRIFLQPVASLGVAKIMGAYGEELAAMTAQHNGVFGPVIYPHEDMSRHIERAFDLAIAHDLDLDFHVDENLDPQSHGLLQIANETVKRGYEGRVVCGHACSLSVLDEATRARTLAAVKDARITIAALLSSNLQMMDRRTDQSPRLRGGAPIVELKKTGIEVAFGSDNVRDPFNPYGDYDLVEIYKDASRIGHADLPLGPWASAVGKVPFSAMNIAGGVIAVNEPADLVIFEARSFSELFARPGDKRRVLVGGRQLDAPLPSYRELDDLFAAYPANI